MSNFTIYASSLSMVVSAFLLVVASRAFIRVRSRIFVSLIAVFLVILVESVISLVSLFDLVTLPFSLDDMLVFGNIIVLIVFYAGVLGRK
ncbi:MAG: hypothetical protein M1616_05570 [Candidatus Thermoplasmatota archaeon]|jgi:hypothetical protein|nr:hypothetical protein [Candidatus Thermoplasmatota archaeon]